MNGFVVKKLLCAHGLDGHMNGLQNIWIIFCESTDCTLYVTGEALFYQCQIVVHFRFAALAAQRDQSCLSSPHIISLFWKTAPHGIGQMFDQLVTCIESPCTVDDR